MYTSTLTLRDIEGQRKYLNQAERLQFLECTKSQHVHIKLFCQLLFYTGARIAEIHNITPENIDFSNKSVVLETLKKRKRGVFREIPLPDFLLKEVELYLKNIYTEQEKSQKLWYFSLRTASRYVKAVLLEAGIHGIRGSAKSLRHGYAVTAVQKAPITLVKKWLGHSSLETTEIYLDILGFEEREIAKRMWFE